MPDLLLFFVAWPFVGAATGAFFAFLFSTYLTRSGFVFVFMSRDELEEYFGLKIAFCVIGGILGWILVFLAPFGILLWMFVSFVLFLTGAQEKLARRADDVRSKSIKSE